MVEMVQQTHNHLQQDLNQCNCEGEQDCDLL